MHCFKYFILVCVLFFQTIQSQNESKEFYIEYDSEMGLENSDLNKGKLFNEQYRTKDRSHMFLKQYDFVTSSIDYDGQVYFDVNLKYDLLNDQVIKKSESNKNSGMIVLRPEFISSFKINNKHFVRLENTESLKGFYDNGFFETVLNNQNTHLYVKHKKTKKQVIINKSIYFTFLKRTTYILEKDNIYYNINSKKNLTALYPNSKKMINSFYAKQEKELDANSLKALLNTLINKAK